MGQITEWWGKGEDGRRKKISANDKSQTQWKEREKAGELGGQRQRRGGHPAKERI